MARNLFGGTAADVAEDIDGKRVPGAVGTVWDGPSEEAVQVVDLTDADGVPVIQLVADNRGFIPAFYGPSNHAERLWVDFGVGRVGLVSVTVGDRLKSHTTAADPHQDRAYTDEQLVNYFPRAGGELTMAAGQAWITSVVSSQADTSGHVLQLKTVDGVEKTRLRNNGSLYVDTVGKYAPLCVGAPDFPADTNVINVVNGPASPSSELHLFQVKGDGTVNAKGAVNALNIGSARVFSGPNAPASPKPGDVWVQYG
ncbi:hypothetical protein [Streptomyces uncialis]|uniref:hypothetical protein n=1 Tax=Streptomyces uncialis TaxID=1048205 RepID=UPI00093CC8B4|nr:hypothetical protein [Streptomyces uncialis]